MVLLQPWQMIDVLRAWLAEMETDEALVQQTGDVWHEAQRALQVSDEAEHDAHLAWAVVPAVWRPVSAQAIGLPNVDELELSVFFTYRMRPDREPDDMVLVLRAADALVRRISQDEWTSGAASSQIVTKARLNAIPEQPYIAVESAFILRFLPGD